MKKIIVIESCTECPLQKECKAWKALTAKQRVSLLIGVGVPGKFILKNCPLPDDSTEEK